MRPTKIFGLLSVIVYVAALEILAVLKIQTVFEYPLFLPIFNTLFLGILPVIVAYIAGKSYLKGGSVTVLLMGCGMLSLGLGAIAAGWMIRASNGANVNVMIFNTGALLSSLFHAGAAISFHLGGSYSDDAGRRKLRIVSAYVGIVLFVVFFSFAALEGLIPSFFIQGLGPTPLRQVVLGSATFLYFISPVVLMASYLKSKSNFIYWYSLCLAMVCIDLVGSFVQQTVGSPMGWLERSAGAVGGIFAAIAVISAMRDAKVKGISLERTISGSFQSEEFDYKRSLLPLLPIPILLFLLVVMLSMDVQTVFEPPGLYALLNIVFLTILPLIVSYYATRGYLRSGLFPMLMLGSGTLALGLSGVLSALIMHWQGGGPDAAMSIFTWLSLLSAIFHLAGGVSVFTGVHPDEDTRHKELILALTYIGITAVAVLVTDMVLKGVIPLFFVHGQGPSALRQVLVGIITVMSTFCALLFLSVYFFSRAKFLYWYSLAMFVFTTAVISYMFVKSIGSPIAWLGRSGLYLASIYLFVAVISASRELRSKGESLVDGISSLFLHHLDSLVGERTLQLTRAKEELQTAYSKLEQTNAELETAIEERTTALRNAAGHNDLLQKIQRAQSQFISNMSPEELFRDLVQDLLSLSNSQFGFIGEILYTDDGQMYFRDRARTDISWDEESRKIYLEFADKQGRNFYNVRGLWGTAILTGEPVISNNPVTDPRRSGMPEGHPALDSFLGLPFLSEGKVIGIAGLANRPSGYNQELVEFLQPFVATCANIIEAYRNENRRRESRQKLFETNQRLQALMDALPVGVSFSDDLSCRNITGNPCLFAQFEISPQDNISASAADPAVPGRLVRFFQNGREIKGTELPLQRAVAENRVIPPIELEVHLLSGRRWVAEASGAPIVDDKGKVVGGVAVTVDITDRKQAQEALQRTHDELELRVRERTTELAKASEAVVAERQRLYEILETMPVMVCLLTPDYHVAFANRSFREKFGESNGRHCYDYRFGLKEPCPFCESYEVLKTRKPHYWEVTGPGGSIIAAHDFPFTDIDGSPLILEMDIDITEQRRAAEDLRASEERYRQMFQNSRAVKLLVDPQSAKIVDANQAASEFYGYELDRLKRLKITDINVLSPEETLKRMSQAYSEEQKYFQFQHRLASGELRFVEVYSTPMDLYGKRLLYSIVHDITDRHKAEEELIRSNQDLQQFAYIASHDLQEPLRNVANCLQMLEQDYKDKLDANADQYIRYAVESSVRMKDLILGLLDYSRVATKGKAPEPVDCEKILRRALMNLGLGIAETGAMITHDPLPTTSADDTQLLQVFQNLIQNAIKFRRDEPPQIHISAVKDKKEWIFSVKDNGIGIQSQHLDRIFVIFQQLHKRGKYEGTGMGLAIVKKVVERHGGRIWAESEPGVGTTFYFTIPEKTIQA